MIVIPARFGSQRLPGKPLVQIAGRTMLERVVAIAATAANRAGSCKVLVATDDERIVRHATDIGVDHVMTASDLASGTDRVFAASRQIPGRVDRVINLQGDAPFTPADTIVSMIEMLRHKAAPVVTPVFPLTWDRLDRLRQHKATAAFSGTTCIRGQDGRALWFSKAIIPAMRNESRLREAPVSPVWQHMGLYGYTMDALAWFSNTSPSHYEELEGLEQLRFIEGGWDVHTVAVEAPSRFLSGIDTPQDLAMAEEAISRFGDPFPG